MCGPGHVRGRHTFVNLIKGLSTTSGGGGGTRDANGEAETSQRKAQFAQESQSLTAAARCLSHGDFEASEQLKLKTTSLNYLKLFRRKYEREI